MDAIQLFFVVFPVYALVRRIQKPSYCSMSIIEVAISSCCDALHYSEADFLFQFIIIRYSANIKF